MNPELLYFTVVLVGSLISILVSAFFQKTFFTLIVAFSLGWVGMSICVLYASLFPDFPIISDLSYITVNRALIGGYLGGILATMLFGKPRTNFHRSVSYAHDLDRILQKTYPYLFGLLFLLGSIELLSAFSRYGVNVFTLQDIRGEHTRTAPSLIERFAKYASFATMLYVILFAYTDIVKGRIRVFRFLLAIAVAFPFALSKASRGELFAPLLIYFVSSFVLLQSVTVFKGDFLNFKYLWRYFSKLAPYVIILLIFFTIYGNLRSIGKSDAGRFEMTNLAEMPLEATYSITRWFAVSLFAAGPISEWVEVAEPRGYGRDYFAFPVKVVERLGFLRRRDVEIYLARQDAWAELGGSIYAFNPGTFAKFLTREFGIRWLPYSAFGLMFFMVGLTTLLPRHNIVTYVLSVLIFKDAFMAPQTISGLNSGNAWILIFAIMMYLTYKYWYPNSRPNFR